MHIHTDDWGGTGHNSHMIRQDFINHLCRVNEYTIINASTAKVNACTVVLLHTGVETPALWL